ncbi:MAG: HAMP domain-containing histidine kinase [Clostridia bacterium]|nr:HAMP domain-containing histidine kinase [Clostridia bacterium]
MKKIKKPTTKNRMLLSTSLFIFVCLFAVLMFFYLLNILDSKLQLYSLIGQSPILTLSIMLVLSIGLGAIVSVFIASRVTKPINEIKSAINKISKGDFSVRVSGAKNKTINEVIENFNKMVEELASIETLKSDFVANVSHEFKTPLSVIQSYSKALRKNELDEQTRNKYEEIVDTNIQKLSNLTTNILMLSKIENQKIGIDKSEFMLDEQIKQCIIALEPEWSSKQIEFELDLPEIKCCGSKMLLSHVWQNLLENAIKFSYEKGKISVVLVEKGGEIFVNISDNGIGISEEVKNHIFEKFYQADTSHSSKGNGLGLALVKQIVEIHNGEIFVESQPQNGTTFTIVLKQ